MPFQSEQRTTLSGRLYRNLSTVDLLTLVIVKGCTFTARKIWKPMLASNHQDCICGLASSICSFIDGRSHKLLMWSLGDDLLPCWGPLIYCSSALNEEAEKKSNARQVLVNCNHICNVMSIITKWYCADSDAVRTHTHNIRIRFIMCPN